MSEIRDYLIATPGYAGHCGGIKSLHKLAHMLNERGFTAYVTGDYVNPEFNTPMAKNLSQEHLRELQHKGIIVYPDIVDCNPCRFTHAVHWWLGASQPPPPNQLIFTLSEMHQVVWKTPNILFIWHIEDYFKFPEVENRTKKCCYPGKGGNQYNEDTNNEAKKDTILITAGFPAPRQNLAKLFQESQVFYTYDNLTVCTVEARLCGCPVVMMGHWIIPKDEYIKKDEFGIKGIGMYDEGPIDLKKLKSEIPEFLETYNARFEKTEKEIDLFIEKTQNWNKRELYVENLGSCNHKIYHHNNFELWGTR